MAGEMILSIPGAWKDRTDFLERIVGVEPTGRYMFAGLLLADLEEKDHVPLEFAPSEPNLANAFRIAGQGKLPSDLLYDIERHTAVAYLRFPLAIPEQLARVQKYASVLRHAGGLAVKVESTGIAHGWDRWTALLAGSPFDVYTAFVVLVGGGDHYYSCGMHHFGLPECAVPRSIPSGAAADLMNRFNFWRVIERPTLADGHTFSVAEGAPRFRMTLDPDTLHETGDPFFNEHGVWRLRGVPTSVAS
jgi:hypothetical protein